jgi:hypothetical protein
LTFRVVRSGDLASSTAVSLAWSGSASFGSDYTVAASGASLTSGGAVLTFAAGASAATLTVTPQQDSTVEANETVTVSIGSGAGYVIGSPASGSGTIADDDAQPLPTVSIGNASVTEGNSGSRTVTLTVSLSAASASTVTVRYQTADGTATVAGNDYVATSGTVTFAPGQTSMTISILVNGDKTKEGNETFFVTLTSPNNATIPPGARGTITIVDERSGLTAPAVGPNGGSVLTSTELETAAAWAIAEWLAAKPGLDLADVEFVVGDLDGALLGEASDGLIVIDVDAAGWGWSFAGGRMDLLTVIRHEIGHLIGLEHADQGLMAETLAVGAIFEIGSKGPVSVLESFSRSVVPASAVSQIAPLRWPTAPLLVSVGMLGTSAFDTARYEIDRLSVAVAEIATAPVRTLAARVSTADIASTDESPLTRGARLAAQWMWLLLALWLIGERQRRRTLRRTFW